MAGSLIKSMKNPCRKWPIFRDIVLFATKHRAWMCADQPQRIGRKEITAKGEIRRM